MYHMAIEIHTLNKDISMFNIFFTKRNRIKSKKYIPD